MEKRESTFVAYGNEHATAMATTVGTTVAIAAEVRVECIGCTLHTRLTCASGLCASGLCMSVYLCVQLVASGAVSEPGVVVPLARKWYKPMLVALALHGVTMRERVSQL